MDNFLRERNAVGYYESPQNEALYRTYWDLVNQDLNTLYSDTINIMIFGDTCQKYVRKLMFLHFLYDYLTQIREQIILFETEAEIDENKALYGIEQLEKNMVCCGFAPKLVRAIMTLFGFGQETITSVDLDGIGYMSVNGTSPIFTIQ